MCYIDLCSVKGTFFCLQTTERNPFVNLLHCTCIFFFEFSSMLFMYQLHHNQLPKNFYHSFHKINTIYLHETRLINSTAYYCPQINKLFSQKLFSHRGSKLWGNLESELKSMYWVSFKKAYKLKLLKEY